MNVISEFRGEYFFMSNFYMQPFEFRNWSFHSAEQAFAWSKAFFAKSHQFVDEYQTKVIRTADPGEAKREGRQMLIDVVAWDKHKDQYMREIIHAKFKARGLAGKLINTGCSMLVEGNNWGDKYWGRVKNADGKWVGLNKLGVILMEERGYWLHSDFKEKK